MGRLVVCEWEGRSLTIEEALDLRTQRPASAHHFYCQECGQRVRAHKAGTTGQGAHFEYLLRNPQCSPGSGPIQHSTGRAQASQTSKKPPPSLQIKWPDGVSTMEPRPDFSRIHALLPPQCGQREFKPTLCIGLDIAWFGGSKGNPNSQYDCVVAAVVGPDSKATHLDIKRVPLIGRDPDGSLTAGAIGKVIDRYASQVQSIVLGIDAPLLSTQVIPPRRARAWRAADRVLSDARRGIDQFVGGSNGWHPTLQPGAPLSPRVVHLMDALSRQHGFAVWNTKNVQHERLVLAPSEN